MRNVWSKEPENWSVDQWQTVIYSDESKLNIFGSDNIHHVWRKSGSTVRQPVSRMVRGYFSYNQLKFIHVIEGRANGEGFSPFEEMV